MKYFADDMLPSRYPAEQSGSSYIRHVRICSLTEKNDNVLLLLKALTNGQYNDKNMEDCI